MCLLHPYYSLPPLPLSQSYGLSPPLSHCRSLPPPLSQCRSLPPLPLSQCYSLPPPLLSQCHSLPPPLSQCRSLPPLPLSQCYSLPPPPATQPMPQPAAPATQPMPQPAAPATQPMPQPAAPATQPMPQPAAPTIQPMLQPATATQSVNLRQCESQSQLLLNIMPPPSFSPQVLASGYNTLQSPEMSWSNEDIESLLSDNSFHTPISPHLSPEFDRKVIEQQLSASGYQQPSVSGVQQSGGLMSLERVMVRFPGRAVGSLRK